MVKQQINSIIFTVDDLMRHPQDKPTLGLILCKKKSRIVAEYALRNTTTPMGIAEFKQIATLPEQLKGTLPTVAQIEAELSKKTSKPATAVQRRSVA